MDVVTFGETMVLFNPLQVGPLRYVSQFEKSIGGAESNVAIGLARLGHEVGWFSKLGKDEFGLFVRNFIRGEGVDTSQVVFDEKHPTGVFFKERQLMKESKIYYYRKGSAASQLSPQDLNEEYLAQAKFMHITGITPSLSHTCKETVHAAIDMAKRNGLTVTFDPNIRLKLWSADEARETLLEIAEKCDIIMPGFDEGSLLTGETTPEGIAQSFLQKGAKAVVIKLGERGAFYSAEGQQEYVEGFPVKQIVDPIGAGDAFASGFLSGLLRGFPYREAVRLANRTGSFALTVAGDVEGLPFWEQVNPENCQEEICR